MRAAIVRMASTRASPDADGVAVTGPLAPPSVTPAMAEEAVEEGEVDVEAEAEVVVRHLVVLVADRGPVVPAHIPRAINFRTERTAA